MKIRLIPNESQWPSSGGVRQHCVMLRRFLSPLCELTDDPAALTHVQSSYVAERVDCYTCHGGFLPSPPIQSVVDNLHKAKQIISVAHWIIDEFFPELAHKTVVIPNGVAVDDWDAVPELQSGIEPGFVLVKAYMSRREDWIIVHQAITRLPGIQFVSIGRSSQKFNTPTLKNLLELPTPVQEQRVQRLMKDCAVFVSPSSEVNPVMALEAMACRKPVIGLDIHGNREVLMSQLRYQNVEGLVQLVRLLTSMPDTAASYGQLSYERVKRYYDWEKLADETLAVYESVA